VAGGWWLVAGEKTRVLRRVQGRAALSLLEAAKTAPGILTTE